MSVSVETALALVETIFLHLCCLRDSNTSTQ